MVIAVLLTCSPSTNKTPVLAGASAPPALPGHRDQPNSEMIKKAYGKLPLSFEANQGQFESQVQFVSRGAGNTTFLTSTDAVLRLDDTQRSESPSAGIITPDRRRHTKPETNSATLRMRLVGANRSAQATGMDELPGKSNYFIGNDPKKWRVNVPTYAKVKYEQVYRGVDLVYYGNQRQLEYDLIVAPGADPGRIELAFDGATGLRLNESGDLVVNTPSGEILQHAPFLYQELDGKQTQVEGNYFLRNRDRVGFDIRQYDSDKALVIDPVLSYSTYLGGTDRDIGYGIAVDAAGDAYVVGETRSADFPTANALYPNFTFFDGFVTKFNASGTALIYSTYLGGSGEENAHSIAVDTSGNAYVTGFTESSNFPTVNAVQSSLHGVFDAFVFKLNSTGSALQYSTYLGGAAGDQGSGVAVDHLGNCYVSGTTSSIDFPTVNAAQASSGGGVFDGFVVKFNPTGSALDYSTYIGGSGSDAALAIAADPDGNTYVTGTTDSTNFPTVNAFQVAFPNPCFKSSNGGKSWSPINNGFSSNEARALAVDPVTPATVYAAAGEGKLFKSVDAGNSWAAMNNGLPTGAPGINAIAIDPSAPMVVYAATTSVYKSLDGGANWQFSGAGITNRGILCLVIDPKTPSTLYAGTFPGVFKSTNAGATWSKVSNGIPNDQISSLAIDPVNTSTLYAASSGRLYKTTNGGANWTAIRFSGATFNPMAIDPLNPSTLYLGQGSVIAKSTNGGSSFAFISLNIRDVVDSLVIDPTNPAIIYAATFGSGILKSINSGATWTAINNGISNYLIEAVAINPQAPSTLYLGMYPTVQSFITKLNSSGTIAYSTYLAGRHGVSSNTIAADNFGNAYVAGWSVSSDFPLVNPVQFFGSGSAFVTELNSNGSALIFSTFFGGSQFTNANAIAVDDPGNIYVGGQTQSADFPIVNPVQAAFGGVIDGFILKLNPGGAGIAYSTYLGGSKADIIYGIAVDPAGNAYVTGQTISTDLPTTAGAFQPVNHGILNAFVAKLGAFDICLQDESTGNVLSLNTTTGNYKFAACGGITIDGVAVISKRGCLLTVQDNGPDRRLLARVDTCLNNGTASIQLFSLGKTFTILDRNTTNNTCACSH